MAAPIRHFARCRHILPNHRVSKHFCCPRITHFASHELRTHLSASSGKFIGTLSRSKCLTVGITSFTLGCAVVAGGLYVKETQQHIRGVSAAERYDDGDKPAQTLRQRWSFIADVVEKTAPALVYIELQGMHPFTGQMMSMSNGSGFVVREDGLILTNAHVVANKQVVIVKLKDGRTFKGTVQAVDPVSDLATLKINATGLPTIKLGKSSDMRVGEWVVALGSPFQLSNTVTAGIISTVNRGSKELGLAKDMDYIQTDAVINFGNSGGPLVNLDGEAIGINTMKVTAGISFAIPSDYIKNFLDKAKEMENRSTSSRGWFGLGGSQTPRQRQRYIGITMLTLTPSILPELRALQEGFPGNVESGVLVYKVVVGSPAFDGGLRPMDIITKINGKNISDSTDVYRAVETQSALKITIQRGPETITLTISPEIVD